MRAAGTGARWRPVEADGGGAVWGGMLKGGVRASIPRTRAGRNQAAGRLVRRLRRSLSVDGDIEVILELADETEPFSLRTSVQGAGAA